MPHKDVIRSDLNTLVIRSDLNINSQIAQVWVRVLYFSQQDGKTRGGHTYCGGFWSPVPAARRRVGEQ